MEVHVAGNGDADAMRCRKAIARRIIESGGDYVLALQGNQETLHQDAKRLIEHAEEHRFADPPPRACSSVEKGHGRIVTRRLVQADPAALDGLWQDARQEGAGVAGLVMLKTKRRTGDRVTSETRCYISSPAGDAPKAARAIRRRWSIENRLHWVPDVIFDEDQSRIREGHAPQNFAVIRHMAPNLLRRETGTNAALRPSRSGRAGTTTTWTRFSHF